MTLMKSLGLALATQFILVFQVYAAPIDNPVATYYKAKGYMAWTDSVKWSRVLDMKAYKKGSTEFERFENARDELFAQGGGVLYYPAGTYDFSTIPSVGPSGRGLMLKSGVVIRGEMPSVDADAADGTLKLATRFVFPFQNKGGGMVPGNWNFVGLKPVGSQGVKDVNNVGIVWVHCVGATVYFGPQIKWGATYATASSWKSSRVVASWKSRVPDGTHPMDPFCGGTKEFIGVGKGRVVFGCVFEDACVLNDVIDEGAGADGFYMDKFGARIAVYGSRVLVANNLLPRSSRNFIYQQKTCATVQNGGCTKQCSSTPVKDILFDYGKTCGIDINKSLLGYCDGNNGLLVKGVVVTDNYVYNHGNKGFEIAGTWVTIANNHNERDYLDESKNPYGTETWELTLDGYVQSTAGGPGCISDNLSRGFDLAGQNLWIHKNYLNNTGSNPGNDGEGILCQSWAGTQIWSWAMTYNTHEKGTGEPGYIGGYDVAHEGCLNAWNKTAGFVGSENNKANGLIDCAFVANSASGGTRTSSAEGKVSDVVTQCPSQAPVAPINVVASVTENDHVLISWTDNADSEIGFRVERKAGNGEWATIAYRPPKSKGTDRNPQLWADFLAPGNVNLIYRVVALQCDDNSAGASTPSAPVKIASPTTALVNQATGGKPVVPLNRAGAIVLESSGPDIEKVRICSLDGRQVQADMCIGNGYVVVASSSLAKGIYFVRVYSKDSRCANHRVVIEK